MQTYTTQVACWGKVKYVLSGRMVSSTFLLATTLAFSAMIASGMFLSWNILLVMTNQTTIEIFSNWSDRNGQGNIYDIGMWRNLHEVFGNVPWYRCLLPSFVEPLGDGIVYPQNMKNLATGTRTIRHERDHSSAPKDMNV